MKLEDLDKETIAKYAKSDNEIIMAFFLVHPNLLVNLLGEIGQAEAVAEHLRQRMLAADIAQITGEIKPDVPEHADMEAAIRNAAASVELSFQTVLDAVVVVHDVINNCKCMRCQQRRHIKNAEAN